MGFSKEASKEYSGGSRYVKLDNENYRGVVFGEPVHGRAEFSSREKKWVYSETGKMRFGVNCWSKSNGFQLLTGSKRLWDALATAEDDFQGGLENKIIEIQKVGSGFNTDYKIKLLGSLTEDLVKEMNKQQPMDLQEECAWAFAGLEKQGDELPF